MITNEVINEIRNKVNIVDIISNYVPLTKKGKNYFGLCPFHDDHSPSMSVSFEKQIYTCFVCHATGNVFSFVSEYEHIGFYDAVRLIGSKLGYNLDTKKKEITNNQDLEIYELACKYYQNSLNTSLGNNAIDYLTKRKIDRNTISKFRIGLSMSKSSLTEFLLSKNIKLDKLISLGISNERGQDLFVNRIMFPLYDLSGNVVAFSGRIYNTHDESKYINTKETNIFKKGNLLYNYHLAKEHLKKSESIIVMEGFMDVIRASVVGINNCVATMGTAFTKEQALLLKKTTNNIILCFDGDNAGDEATDKAIQVLKEIDVTPRIIRLEENLDPDEYILKYGKDPNIDKGIIILDEFDKLAYKGEESGSVSTMGIQNELLKMIEGNTYNVEVGQRTCIFDTKSITFVCCGAFQELYEDKKTPQKSKIGFGSISSEESKKESQSMSDKLVSYGLKREIVGRLPIVLQFNALTKDNLKDIILNSKTSEFQEYIRILKEFGIENINIDDLVDIIVNDAMERKIGARGLTSTIVNMFNNIMYEVFNNPGEYDTLHIGSNILNNPNDFTLSRSTYKKEKLLKK